MGFLFCFSFLGLVRPLVSFSIDSSAWVGGLCVFPWIFLFFSFVVCGFFFSVRVLIPVGVFFPTRDLC